MITDSNTNNTNANNTNIKQEVTKMTMEERIKRIEEIKAEMAEIRRDLSLGVYTGRDATAARERLSWLDWDYRRLKAQL